MKEFRVKEHGYLFAFLSSLGFRRTKLKQLLKFRAVTVNDRLADRHDHPLTPGDRVAVSAGQKSRAGLAPKLGIRVVYEDEALLVIDKPEGLLTIATDTEKVKTAYFQLNEYLKESGKRERIFIVHRLDRETSGLLVFAKTEAVKRRLQEGWADTGKQYMAVIEGVPKKAEDRLTGYLNETSTMRVYATRADGKAKYAVTKYKVLKSSGKFSLVEIDIETGRKHQIRVQLSDIGHPVAGDKKYGAKTDPLTRLALHAYRISIIHPLSGNRMEFESGAPRQFAGLFERMKS